MARAGKLRHPILIQTLGEPVSDGSGGKTYDPATFLSVNAAITPNDGSEKFEAARTIPVVSHLVEIRYRAGVTTKHRVKYGTRLFNIKFVQNVQERNKTLFLFCEEIVV